VVCVAVAGQVGTQHSSTTSKLMKLLLYHRGTAEGDEMSGGALLYALLWWWMDGWTGCLLNLIAICVRTCDKIATHSTAFQTGS
jgi:hypothetical protein